MSEELSVLVRAVVATVVVVAGVMLLATHQQEVGQAARGAVDALPGSGMISSPGHFLVVRTTYHCPNYVYRETNHVYSMEEVEKRAAAKFGQCDPEYEVIADNRRPRR